MFWKNKKVNSAEYEILMNKFTELKADQADLKNNFEKHKDLFNSLRGVVNRKLHRVEDEEISEEPKEEAQQELNTSVILPEDGNIKLNRKRGI